MEGLTCRLLPYAVADGATNMAADETLLKSAAAGIASLRFYSWSRPTLSLGYFQSERLRHADPLLAALSYVRRPSGGDTLVHHHEVTYALALPAGAPWQARGVSWLRHMHGIIAAALETLGISARLHEPTGEERRQGPLCFHHWTAGDLLVGRAKVVGSAQRKRRGALLQHGAILLGRSRFTPSLPGIRELTGRVPKIEAVCQAVQLEFERTTGCELRRDYWAMSEQGHILDLYNQKYTQEVWNRKR